MASAASVHLYHWPTSFFSQKVVVALEEKHVKYTETIINISMAAAEQNEAWFLRLNPKGQVPVIKIGDKYISGSRTIVDVVDKLDNAPTLVPDPTTAEGKLVQEWRNKLYGLDIERLIFGILLNPELADGELNLLPHYRQTKEEYMVKADKILQNLEAMKEKYPDLREALEAKIKVRKCALGKFEKSDVVASKEYLEKLFDELEVELRKSRNENIVEHWLCGPNFTAADISLCVLIGRLPLIGLFDRYLNPTKRPATMEYWNHAKLRPSVQTAVLGAGERLKIYMSKKITTGITIKLAIIGVLLALVAVFFRLIF